MSKLKKNSPMPLHVPKKKGEGDEGTEAVKNSSTIVGQPELNPKTNTVRQKEQLNERKDGAHPYTD